MVSKGVSQRERLGCFNGFDFHFGRFEGGVREGGSSVIGERGGGDGVAHGDRGGNALDHGGDGGVSMTLDSGIGKVAAQAIRPDDGAVVSGSADQSGGRKSCDRVVDQTGVCVNIEEY